CRAWNACPPVLFQMAAKRVLKRLIVIACPDPPTPARLYTSEKSRVASTCVPASVAGFTALFGGPMKKRSVVPLLRNIPLTSCLPSAAYNVPSFVGCLGCWKSSARRNNRRLVCPPIVSHQLPSQQASLCTKVGSTTSLI